MTCNDVDAAHPSTLANCQHGSGHLGQWVVDDSGLPAYDFAVEQRCDPVATAYSPRARPLRDPIHLIGNGRGLVAMAHASGGVEIYTQDRGHKWINRIDTWADPLRPDFPPQLGGGFSYYSVAQAGKPARVGSTRFEDLPVNHALERQSRRFGVGYYETVTRESDIVVRRRVLAPDHAARALVSEVVVENPTGTTQQYGLVELWDINLHQVSLELLTSDIAIPGITDQIDRRRRDLANQFTHQVAWDADERVALITTQAKAPPTGVVDRTSVSRVDFFPDPIYLAVLDDAQPDAVWLSDSELWPDQQRTPPAAVAAPGNAASRTLDLDGSGQHAVLAVRVPIELKAHASTTLRFAFGYVPGGGSPDAAVAALRQDASHLGSATATSWRNRLVWAAFPGLPQAGVVQRELAWAAYNAIANTTYDEYRGVRLLGQGGSYKYIHGLDGAMGDLALFAEAMILVDPQIARDTLTYALATQLGGAQRTPWRFPYATTGVGAYSDVGIYDQRSDAYYFLPAAIGRYAALTRDVPFLQHNVPYYPRAAAESGTVLDHIGRALDYGTETLGFGARGLVAIGTGDYADGIDSLATEPATRTGTSSTYNAGALVYGFPLAADVVESFDAVLAARLRTLAESQGQALLDRAWEGSYFYRGFVDSGNPLAPHIFFLEPQVFPILAGIVDAARRDAALAQVAERLETSIGAISNVKLGDDTTVGGPDQPLIGGIWPVANAWLTAAYARRNADEAWSSFTRNTLAAHAEKYPDLWYGIWTGPDSFNGPDSPRPGEADAHQVTALTDYPALNAHMHTSPLRALVDLVGVQGTRDGIRITPHLPTETFSVVWPRLAVRSSPTGISGSYTAASDGIVVLEIALPSGLRAVPVVVTVDGSSVPSSVESDVVRFEVATRAEQPVPWQVARAS
ncbi:MAG: hypothetical protein HY270_05385 [Deltaproteobacteria bacterium]|nr:hypothetical protein [Deltaproteobacteria bacterium]